MVTFEASAEPVMELADRMAQAERKRNDLKNQMVAFQELFQQAQRERDAALANAERLQKLWDLERAAKEHFMRQVKATEKLLKDADAYQKMRAKDLREARAHAERRSEEATKAEYALNSITARIETILVNEEYWRKFTLPVAQEVHDWFTSELRAVLQPPEPENALSVLSRIEKEVCGAGAEHYNELQSDLSKLRKLIKEGN